MPNFPFLQAGSASREATEVFAGYNHNLRIGDGEWYDTKNLTNDYYPVMSSRTRRGKVHQMEAPQGLLAKDSLAYIDDGKLYYNGYDMSEYLPGVQITEGEKTMVSMGAYLCIFPDGIYLNTENYEDSGTMANKVTIEASESNPVTFTLSKLDGSAIDVTYTQDSEPEKPANGAYWLDTSVEDGHVLKIFSSSTAMWSPVATVYTRIDAPGLGEGFKKHDGVRISGLKADQYFDGNNWQTANESDQAQLDKMSATLPLYDAGGTYVVVVGILDRRLRQTSGTVTLERRVPDMDFVTESGNRLWGCKYGVVDGKTVNEIYCCVLGDFKNWERYLGLSTDAWAATQGTDGQWTGAVTHLGYPLFFKEDQIHKVYPSGSGAHQIVVTPARGVQKDSHKSLCRVGEILYYKSRMDVCAYDGSLPTPISQALGTVRYSEAVAGSYGDKYLISMKDAGGAWHLFVYDTAKGMWLRQDDTQALFFAEKDQELYYVAADKALYALDGTAGEREGPVEWYAETGVIGFAYPDHKYLSRFNLRMALEPGADMDLYLQYDSDGIWRHMGHMSGLDLRTFTLPIRPRRCDHLRMRLEGCGGFKLYSLARILDVGSDE